MTALDALGPYNVLQLLWNVNTVFVSHNKELYGDRVLAMEANASFDEVGSPNPSMTVSIWCEMCFYQVFCALMELRSADLESKSVRLSFCFTSLSLLQLCIN